MNKKPTVQGALVTSTEQQRKGHGAKDVLHIRRALIERARSASFRPHAI